MLARLLEPLSVTLARADRGAAAIRLDLRLVDRSTHARMLQLPAAIRDPRVLRTLLTLDLESHPPTAAVDIVTIEIDPAPARVVQYSLLERARPSVETLATLTARLSALVGETRAGAPALRDSHGPDAFEMQPFNPAATSASGAARRAAAGRAEADAVFRRFRPPIAVRVDVDHGRPARVAIARRGLPAGRVDQSAGPWRGSGDWWAHDAGMGSGRMGRGVERRFRVPAVPRARHRRVVSRRGCRLIKVPRCLGAPVLKVPRCQGAKVPRCTVPQCHSATVPPMPPCHRGTPAPWHF